MDQEQARIITKPGDVAGTSKISITSTAKSIVFDGSTAVVAVSVAKLAANETATISVDNADLTAATDSISGALQVTGDGAVEPKNGYVSLALGNLTKGYVTIKATAKVGTKTTGSSSFDLPLVPKPKVPQEK